MNNNSDFLSPNEAVDDVEMLVGWGSTALTYKVRIDGRLLLMKRLRPELRNEKRFRYLFYKEFNTGKEIKSPYVVEYVDIKDDAAGLCILMEYISGNTLQNKLLNEPEYFLREENVSRFLLQLCQALKALHKVNVVHMDISPDNIIISQASNELKLLDLGFCLSNYDDTTPGCSPSFSAPEITSGNIKEIDARTDIFAVGCILKFIEEKIGAKFTGCLQRIMQRCLQPSKENRYNNVDEIIAAINSGKRRKCLNVAAVAFVVLLLLYIAVPFVGQCYRACRKYVTDYIAWERRAINDKFEEGGFYYRVTDHDARTVELTYKGNTSDEFYFEYGDGVVEIPSTVTHRGRTFRVTSIDSKAFDNPETTSIIFTEGLETIKNEAFFDCRLTGAVYIPKSVTSIGSSTFEGNVFIDSFFVHGDNPVYDSRNGCNAIIETASNTLVAACQNTVIPADVTALGDNSYMLYQGQTFVVPQNVTSIGNYAFYMSAVEEVVMHDGVTSVGSRAFEACRKLQKVCLPKGLLAIEKRTFFRCGLQEVVIPDAVTSIGERAFANNSSLQTVVIGSGVERIAAYAFEDCPRLTKITSRIPADKLTAVGSGCFNGVSEQCVLYVPRGAKNCYKNTTGWDVFAKIVEVDM